MFKFFILNLLIWNTYYYDFFKIRTDTVKFVCLDVLDGV